MPQSLRIGFDIGGTFTDFVLADAATGALRLHKLPDHARRTRRSARWTGLRRIIAERMARSFADVAEIVHGTTLVTNAHDRAQGREARPDHHRGLPRRARGRAPSSATTSTTCSSPFPSRWCRAAAGCEVAERIDRDGARRHAARRGRRCADGRPRAGARRACEAVAICFLNAYREPRA